MKILTLETTCDETAAAVVTDDLQVLGAAVASQHDLHARFHGVVPEIASRAHVERILPIVDETLRLAGVSLDELDAVAVANTPGLAGSLLVGLAAAKALCVALDLPLVAVNHLQAHVYACRLAAGEDVFPCVALIVSGGHSSLYACRSPLEFDLLGSTIDDAAGEAFDKAAALLDLGFPGGPAIQHAAESGNPRAFRFPRSFYGDDSRLDFSFSGLKTALRYHLEAARTEHREGTLPSEFVADTAASFQAAIVEALVDKCRAAMRTLQASRLCVGGGVAANAALRSALEELAARQGFRLFVAPLRLCTDNAVMGAIAVERIKAGLYESLDLDIYPGLVRPARN